MNTNIERLSLLRLQMSQNHASYVSAASELLQWLGDPRAYVPSTLHHIKSVFTYGIVFDTLIAYQVFETVMKFHVLIPSPMNSIIVIFFHRLRELVNIGRTVAAQAAAVAINAKASEIAVNHPSAKTENTKSSTRFPFFLANLLSKEFKKGDKLTSYELQFALDADQQHHNLLSADSKEMPIAVRIRFFRSEDKSQRNRWPSFLKSIQVNGVPVNLPKKRIKASNKEYLVHAPVDIRTRIYSSNQLKIIFGEFMLLESWTLTIELVQMVPQSFVKFWVLHATICTIKNTAEFDRFSTSVNCPITKKLVQFPVRGRKCRHPEVFDLEPWLNTKAAAFDYSCPKCGIYMSIDDLVHDHLTASLIRTLQKGQKLQGKKHAPRANLKKVILDLTLSEKDLTQELSDTPPQQEITESGGNTAQAVVEDNIPAIENHNRSSVILDVDQISIDEDDQNPASPPPLTSDTNTLPIEQQIPTKRKVDQVLNEIEDELSGESQNKQSRSEPETEAENIPAFDIFEVGKHLNMSKEDSVSADTLDPNENKEPLKYSSNGSPNSSENLTLIHDNPSDGVVDVTISTSPEHLLGTRPLQYETLDDMLDQISDESDY